MRFCPHTYLHTHSTISAAFIGGNKYKLTSNRNVNKETDQQSREKTDSNNTNMYKWIYIYIYYIYIQIYKDENI